MQQIQIAFEIIDERKHGRISAFRSLAAGKPRQK
jgi:hypothetical protein